MSAHNHTRFFPLLKAFFCLAIAILCWSEFSPPVTATELRGSIDFHVHSAPDVTPRLYDDLELVQRAEAAGMAGIVLKNHVTPTADRAVLAHKVVPGIEVYGGVVLNQAVGGLNLEAIKVMDRLGEGRGKIVWLPTIDAAHHRQTLRQLSGGLQVTRRGKLVSEMQDILQYIGDRQIILGTGHISPAEILTVVAAAPQFGIEKILVTHAMATVPGLTLDQMQILADQGALLELTYVNTLMGANSVEADHHMWGEVTIAAMAEAIQSIGAKHFVLSTDLGRSLDPSPIEGYQTFLDELAAAGIPETDLNLMSHTNPQWLLE
ncbi:MAG: histidinol phosphatase [Limnothrix sp. RL_2_0]|nr:histidinol phosphatase [Limnothrix sp. RL_2_0]